MITVSNIGYNGRLGNQMFQYAAGFALARKLSVDFVVSEENTKQKLTDSGGNISRCYLYDIFPHLTAKKISRKNLKISNRYMQSGFGFNPDFFFLKDMTDLWGYFQSEKWFLEYSEDVREEFRIDPILSENKGFIHIRRGDYCRKSDYHPLPDMDYYSRALEVFRGIDFLIFSDEPDWCKSYFKESRFLVVENTDELNTLRMMTGCEYAIIANSSFSWWGSWLGNSKTIAPRKWFGQKFGPESWKDICREEWIII